MHSGRKEAELNRYLKRSEAAEASAAARSQRAVVTGASPQSLWDVRELLGPAWTIEGEDPERYEQLLVRVAEAVGPIDFVDWLLVKDVVALTWDIQRSRRQSETVIRIGRLEALKQILNQGSFLHNTLSEVNFPAPGGPEFWGEVQPPASLKGLDIPSRRTVFVPWKPSRRPAF